MLVEKLSLAAALYESAMSHRGLGDHGQAVATFDRALTIVKRDDSIHGLRLNAMALRFKAAELDDLGRQAELAGVAKSLAQHIDGNDDSARAHALLALNEILSVLARDHMFEERLDVLENMIEQLAHAPYPEAHLDRELALIARAETLTALGREEEASLVRQRVMRNADEILDRLEARMSLIADDGSLDSAVNMAGHLQTKALVFGRTGRNSEALEILDELIERYKATDNHNLERLVREAYDLRDAFSI
jgi:tetratricopeptide (TPR) repeat protein